MLLVKHSSGGAITIDRQTSFNLLPFVGDLTLLNCSPLHTPRRIKASLLLPYLLHFTGGPPNSFSLICTGGASHVICTPVIPAPQLTTRPDMLIPSAQYQAI